MNPLKRFVAECTCVHSGREITEISVFCVAIHKGEKGAGRCVSSFYLSLQERLVAMSIERGTSTRLSLKSITKRLSK